MITLESILATRELLKPWIKETPVIDFVSNQGVALKLEHLQRGGSFKIRGALANVLRADPSVRARGLTAMSAGNHAIAVALTAELLGLTAKVVMPVSLATKFRIEICRVHGATVELVEGRAACFARAQEIASSEGRLFVPPFDSIETMNATGVIGLEILEQSPRVEILCIPVGGGGLIGGIAAAVKLLRPDVRVVGVEPVGANLMRRSLEKGVALSDEHQHSIADGLTPPFVGRLCFEICQKYVDEIVTVEDDTIIDAMRTAAKQNLILEPAGATALAAVPANITQNTVAVLSGGNISPLDFAKLLS